MNLNLSCFNDLEISSSTIFSQPEIYSVILNPPPHEHSSMSQYFNDIVNSGFINVSEAYTGDVAHNDQLHQALSFTWLTNQLSKYLISYINRNIASSLNFDIFCQKAWPVFLEHGNSINPHKHNNAHLSAVYYFSCPSNNGGDIVFSSTNNYFPSLGSFHQPKNRFLIGIKPFTNLLLIFPSSITHQVTTYHGSAPRLSVSFDIFLSASESSPNHMKENISTNPLQWSLLNK